MSATGLNRALMIAVLVLTAIWLVLPFTMAVLWSLVDPAEPWTADKLIPPVMSFYRWQDMWENSLLKQALVTSYSLAPLAAILSLLLAVPTAYALGRISFPGRELAKLLCLLPLVVPGFVTALFFTSLLFQLGIQHWRFGGILFAHAVLALPYAIRILTVSFEQVRQDHIDAARDLGASTWARFRCRLSAGSAPWHLRDTADCLHSVDRGIRHRLYRRQPGHCDHSDPAVFRPRPGFRPAERRGAIADPRRPECDPDVDSRTTVEIRQSDAVIRQRLTGMPA